MSKKAPCSRCNTDEYVRAEQVISGRRVTQVYYCGRCNEEWRVENAHTPERRQADRRARLDDAIHRLEKRPARAATRERRNVS